MLRCTECNGREPPHSKPLFSATRDLTICSRLGVYSKQLEEAFLRAVRQLLIDTSAAVERDGQQIRFLQDVNVVHLDEPVIKSGVVSHLVRC